MSAPSIPPPPGNVWPSSPGKSGNCSTAQKEGELLLRRLEEAEAIRTELMIRRAQTDLWYWVTRLTRTKDEQDPAHPYKPFPQDEYLRILLEEFLPCEPVSFIEKSRTMLASWTVSAWCAHLMFTREAIGVVFQSRDEDRAVHDVDYCKILWDNSPEALKERWPLKRPLERQPYNRMEIANGSWCIGITGDPQKIRSEHPTIVVLDEAAHIESDANYNIAQATRCRQIICLSSAWPGWFREATEFALPVEWPDYRVKARVF
jgi:hypothetical protein